MAALRAVPIALDPSSAAGVLSGSSQVGSKGQALWSMALDVAPGVAGLAPDLSINYDSTGGNGALGLGFSLGGMSSVRRCPGTIADDEQWLPVRWTNEDAICLGGDRLVLEDGAYGQNGARYRPAHDPAVRVVQHGPLSDRSGSFEVFQSTGHVLTYGTAAATLWRGANPTQSQPYVWGLVQRRDRFANTVDYEYEYPTMLTTGPGDMRLARIRYGGTGPLASRRQVSFTYEARPDAVDSWWFGAHQRVESRLQRIDIYGPSSLLLRRYWFGYDNGGDADRSHLKSLAVCDAIGVCLPPLAFAWAEPPGESWGQVGNFEYFPVFGRPLFGLGGDDLTELFFSNRGAIVTDLDGDLKHEILLRPDSPYTSEMFLWRPDVNNEDTNEEFYMPAAPAMPSYLDTEIRIALAAGTPPGADLFARVQPPLGATVISADGDRRSDILTAKRPLGGGLGLDSDGYLHAQGFFVSRGQSAEQPDGAPIVGVASYEVADLSGELTYSVVPMDHDGDLATDAWLCRGSDASTAEWVLMRNEQDGAVTSVAFSYQPTGLACSVHDELLVRPLPGGGQRLLVVPAYDAGGEPLADSERNAYMQLELDLVTGVSSWKPAVLPRDRYQRWHDRQCRNGIANAAVGLPVYGAGLGLDRQLDVNGDGLTDILRFELAVGDGSAQLDDIVDDLRDDTDGLDADEWDAAQICDADVVEHRDAVIRLWMDTGEVFVDGGIVQELEGIAHANFWVNFVGAVSYDITDDGLMDVIMPSLGPGGKWTVLASGGDGSFAARPTGLPDGWPNYSDDAQWEASFDAAAKVRTFPMGRDNDESEVNDDRPAIAFIGIVENEGEEPPEIDDPWLVAANLWYASDPSDEGEHVVQISHALGSTTAFDYTLVDASTTDWVTGPRIPLGVAPWVVEKVTTDAQTEAVDGDDPDAIPDIQATVETTYEYSGAVVDRRGRGFLGFEEVRSSQFVGPEVVTQYHVDHDALLDDYPTAGRPRERVVSSLVHRVETKQNAEGRFFEIARTQWEWSTKSTLLVGGSSRQTYASATRERVYSREYDPDPSEVNDFDGATIDALGLVPYNETLTSEARDAFGTVLSSVRETVLGERVEMTADDEAIVHDTAAWLLGQVPLVTVESCSHSGDCKTRTTRYTYDAVSGLPSHIIEEPDDPVQRIDTSLHREAHGNVALSIATPGLGAARATSTAWDAEGVSPMSVANALGQTSHLVHHPASGALIAAVEPAGTTRHYTYDGFYRQTRVDRRASPMGVSDGAPTRTEYLLGPEPTMADITPVVMRVRETQTSGQRMTAHVNKLGQTMIRTWRGAADVAAMPPPTIGAGADVYERFRYDAHGRAAEHSVPQWVGSEPLGWHHVEHDALGREVRSVAPDGAVLSTTTYSHTTEVSAATTSSTFDTNDKITTAVFNRDGRVVRSTDQVGSAVCFTHGAFGNVLTTWRNCGVGATGPQPITTSTFDSRGRLTAEEETGWGAKELEYNAFGEVVWQQDGNGDEATIVRDAIGRASSQTDADGISTFVWDTNRPGRLTSASSPDGVVTMHEYDTFGRTLADRTQVTSNSGQDLYSFEYKWGPGDRLDELTYPTADNEPGFKTRMQYDATGRMRAVYDIANATPLWVWRTANARDQIRTESFANGATTTRTWNDVRGWPLRIDTTSGAGGLQRLEYGWLASGELQWREDEQYKQREDFTYDDARRLTRAEVFQDGISKAKQDQTYDVLGNLKSKTEVGNYTYDGDGKLLAAGATPAFHDNAGNIVSLGPSSFAHTAFHKVRTAKSGTTSLSFAYDADGARVLRTAGAAQTISIGSGYERTLAGPNSTAINYNVMAAGRVVARIERTKVNGAWLAPSTYGVHDDRLGSTHVVSRNNGNVLRRIAYDAWGAARNATNWVAPAAEVDTTGVGRGFTGHRARLDIGLIDMGGRMYDPRLARFTSMDPVVANPLDAQAYNGYSYVGNRPLRFTDPSGWVPTDSTDPWKGNLPDGGQSMSGPAFWKAQEGGLGHHRQISVPSGQSDPGVGWRQPSGPTGAGLGSPSDPGPHMRYVGGGWTQITMKGFGTRLFHVSGFSIGHDEVHDYTEQYNARIYAGSRPQGNPFQGLLDFSAALDITTSVALTLAATVNPIARAVEIGISVGDGAVAASNGDEYGVAMAAVSAGPVPVGVGKVGSAVKAYEVGTASALKARSVVGDGIDIHHAAQAHAMKQLVPGYSRKNGPAIALTKAEHAAIPNLSGQVKVTPRQALAQDIRNLRRHTGAPNSALQELIQLNKTMFPGAFAR